MLKRNGENCEHPVPNYPGRLTASEFKAYNVAVPLVAEEVRLFNERATTLSEIEKQSAVIAEQVAAQSTRGLQSLTVKGTPESIWEIRQILFKSSRSEMLLCSRDVDGQKQWKSCKPDYLFSVKVMAKFTGKVFLRLLREAYNNNELTFGGSITELENPKKFDQLIALLNKKSWNFYAKEPFNGAEGGLEYLARYVSKTAIGNERILSHDNQQVTFKWRDYADKSKEKIMVLDAHEFIRRYLQHVLPNGLMRIRAFGFLANACKAKNIDLIRSQLIPYDKSLKQDKKDKEPIDALMMRLTGIDINLCQTCKIGHLETTRSILNQWQLTLIDTPPQYTDTS